MKSPFAPSDPAAATSTTLRNVDLRGPAGRLLIFMVFRDLEPVTEADGES